MQDAKTTVVSLVAMSALLWSCGGTLPVPTQRMADAQSAERSAIELGAHQEPQAQLALKLAQDQIAQARKAIADGDNKRADALLVRANADAELAIALSRERAAKAENQKVTADAAAQKTNIGEGGVK